MLVDNDIDDDDDDYGNDNNDAVDDWKIGWTRRIL